MRVLIVSRFLMLRIAAAILLIWFACFCYQAVRYSSSRALYQTRSSFPQLVYVPDWREGPPVRAQAGVLIDLQSGAILYGKNPEQRRAPASTTKMMTAIVALEKGNLSKIVRISRRAAGTSGSSIRLKAGEWMSLGELLEGMMLCSGNDGSVAVAEGVSGDVPGFVGMMNLKAKEIGALKTSFQNPHGLRAVSHFTTALDLALIARYGMSIPKFAALVREKNALLEWAETGRAVEIKNTNRLLWYFEGADGVKTGTTNEAGRCLVASATRGRRQLIAVVLHSTDRWGDCSRLLEYGFNQFQTIKIADRKKPLHKVKIAGGIPGVVNLYPRNDLVAVVRKQGSGRVQARIELDKGAISAPLYPGRVLGKIVYYYQGERVDAVDLIVLGAVRRKWWPW